MEDPEHLVDTSTSMLERALLREGRAYREPEDLRARTLAALGVSESPGIASRALAWLSAKSWKTKLALAVSAVVLVTAVPVSYALLRAASALSKAKLEHTQGVPAPAPARAPEPEPTSAADDSATPAVSPPPAPRQVSAARNRATGNSALRAELAALDTVRSTLADGNPTGALSSLAAYYRAFPRGRLRLEAEVLRIDALAKSGQSEAAKRTAQDFIKRHPDSVLTPRVRPYAD